MRNELTLIELADRYLRGELNTTERAKLEERMRTNAELRELVEDQRVLLGGLQRLALRPAVDKAYRSYKFGKWAPGIGGAVVAALLISGGALWMTGEHEAVPIISPEPVPIEIEDAEPGATDAPGDAPATGTVRTRPEQRDTVIMIMQNGVLTPISAKDTVGKGTMRIVKTVPITASSPEKLQHSLDSVQRAGAPTQDIPAKVIPRDSLLQLLEWELVPKIE
ncbi:MAG: hypothetical protein ACK46G_09125 [Flavobacteriales bacterium]